MIPALGARNGARLIWDANPGAVIEDFRWALIAEDGSVRFVQLPDKPSFEVWGRVSVDRPFKASGLVSSKEVKVIRPTRGLTISGRIVPAKVAVEDDPTVYARAYPRFTAAEGVVNPDGTFVIRGLPEGEYRVVGEAQNGARRSWAGEDRASRGYRRGLGLQQVRNGRRARS